MRSSEGYTPELATQYSILEAINEVSRTLLATNGNKPPPPRKIPRPVSALDLLELEDERDEMNELAERFGMRRPS